MVLEHVRTLPQQDLSRRRGQIHVHVSLWRVSVLFHHFRSSYSHQKCQLKPSQFRDAVFLYAARGSNHRIGCMPIWTSNVFALSRRYSTVTAQLLRHRCPQSGTCLLFTLTFRLAFNTPSLVAWVPNPDSSILCQMPGWRLPQATLSSCSYSAPHSAKCGSTDEGLPKSSPAP